MKYVADMRFCDIWDAPIPLKQVELPAHSAY